ncbi:hypothetical protein ABT187_38155 [Streptomyces sp. NPDC001817]|uniref:alpha/beta fold hydrolase n=1 Tax=Streptomyces sp. NPDC001817 TaxID=3154398 RepID=UPI003328B2BE
MLGRVTLAAPDLRGRGRSGRVPGPYGIPVRADDMAAVVDTLGVERVVPATRWGPSTTGAPGSSAGRRGTAGSPPRIGTWSSS